MYTGVYKILEKDWNFWPHIYYNLCVAKIRREGSENVSQRKVGRPKIEKPKEIKFSIQIRSGNV